MAGTKLNRTQSTGRARDREEFLHRKETFVGPSPDSPQPYAGKAEAATSRGFCLKVFTIRG
jgi:hypothetical protein